MAGVGFGRSPKSSQRVFWQVAIAACCLSVARCERDEGDLSAEGLQIEPDSDSILRQLKDYVGPVQGESKLKELVAKADRSSGQAHQAAQVWSKEARQAKEEARAEVEHEIRAAHDGILKFHEGVALQIAEDARPVLGPYLGGLRRTEEWPKAWVRQDAAGGSLLEDGSGEFSAYAAQPISNPQDGQWQSRKKGASALQVAASAKQVSRHGAEESMEDSSEALDGVRNAQEVIDSLSEPADLNFVAASQVHVGTPGEPPHRSLNKRALQETAQEAAAQARRHAHQQVEEQFQREAQAADVLEDAMFLAGDGSRHLGGGA